LSVFSKLKSESLAAVAARTDGEDCRETESALYAERVEHYQGQHLPKSHQTHLAAAVHQSNVPVIPIPQPLPERHGGTLVGDLDGSRRKPRFDSGSHV
jgi:hypothetical protein